MARKIPKIATSEIEKDLCPTKVIANGIYFRNSKQPYDECLRKAREIELDYRSILLYFAQRDRKKVDKSRISR